LSGVRVHPLAEQFDGVGARYERGRPVYPQAAVDHIAATLGIGTASTVVDVGAGTGKMTRLLVPTGARVVGVEPLAGMRAEFERVLPDVEVRDGTADALPFGAGEADAIVVASAFHWFATPAVLAEFHRVLGAGGGLALVWNRRDTSQPWTAEVGRILEARDDGHPRYASGKWREAFAATDLFTEPERVEFSFEQPMTADTLVDRMLSISFVAALPAADRAEVEARLRAVAAPLGPQFAFPYSTHVYTCRTPS
jgi:SAM-dependent methyltransferase